MKRRDFLKLMGVAGAASMSTSCIETYHWMGTKSRKRHSYLTAKDEDAAKGELRFASTCMECSGGCGVEVRVAQGNAVKLEGNADHPGNEGALCIRGQASLSRLYDPMRLRSPKMKNAEGVMQDTTWKKAYARITEALKANTGKNYYLSGKTTGSLSKLIDEFSKNVGVERLPEFEPYAYENLRMANKIVFGRDELPQYDIENSDVMFTVGADVIDSVSNATQFGKVKAKDDWKWLHVAPHLTASGLKADKRFDIKPESEVYLLRWLIGKLAGSFKNSVSEDLLKTITASNKEVEATGIKSEKLDLILSSLTSAKKPLIVSGGPSTSSESGLEVAVLTAILQWGLGAETLDFTHAEEYSSVGSRKDIANTAKLLKEKKVGVLFVARSNPLDHVPAFNDSFGDAALTVGFGLKYDEETLKKYDIVLPLSHYTESLGDVAPSRGLLNLIQPVTEARGTRQEGDILLEIAADYDANTTLPVNYEGYLYDQWSTLEPEKVFVQDNFLEKGFYQSKVEEVKVSFDSDAATKFIKEEAKWTPQLHEGNTLLIIPSVRFFDGRSRNISLLQEIPDTLTTITYGEWVSIAEKTAKKMGIQDSDVVEFKVGDQTIKRRAKVQPVMAEGILTIQESNLLGSLGVDARSGQAYSCVHNVTLSKVADDRTTPMIAILSGSMESRDDGSIYGRSNGINRRGVVPYNYDPHGHSLIKKNDHSKDHGTKEEHEAHDHSKDHIEHEARQTLYPDNHDEYADKTGVRSPYRWAMAVNLEACNGCSACVAACYVENNISISGGEQHLLGREMSWLRFEPYVYTDTTNNDEDNIEIIPMLCQQCENAPCEAVCPVYATYHNPDGINAQIYNRCVGTRYCANNCPYKVRRFNYFDNGYEGRHLPLHTMHNPSVFVRSKGIMEKCTFCVQRIRSAKDLAKDEQENGTQHGVLNEKGILKDGVVEPACAQTCATGAISFGNILDENSKVYKMAQQEEAHRIFEITGVGPSVYYLGKKGHKDDAGKHG